MAQVFPWFHAFNRTSDFCSHLVQRSSLSPWFSKSGPMFGRSNWLQSSLPGCLGTTRKSDAKLGHGKNQTTALGFLPLETHTSSCISKWGTGGLGGGLASVKSVLQLDVDMTLTLVPQILLITTCMDWIIHIIVLVCTTPPTAPLAAYWPRRGSSPFWRSLQSLYDAL